MGIELVGGEVDRETVEADGRLVCINKGRGRYLVIPQYLAGQPAFTEIGD